MDVTNSSMTFNIKLFWRNKMKMKKLAQLVGIAAIVGTSASAQAWWNDNGNGFGNGFGEGNGSGNASGSFGMSFNANARARVMLLEMVMATMLLLTVMLHIT